MGLPTKKELKEALTPLRKAAERYACSLMTGHKVSKHEPIVWRGITIAIEICSRQQIVCNIPAPYCAFNLYYSACRDGKVICGQNNGTNLVDTLFMLRRQGKVCF
jgi:hypothetical protein